MNIIFIVEDNGVQQEMVNIPVVQNIEPVNCETEDEEFTTINGKKLNLIGGKGLKNFSFSSFFPSKLYSFVSFLNMLCRYNFTYSFRDKAGDVPYTLDIKEYILPDDGDDNV